MRIILRFFGFLFSIGAILFLLGAGALAYFYFQYSKDLPNHAQLEKYEPPVMTRVHAADGSLLAEYARERRLYLPIQAVPKLVIGAFLSAEDKNFYHHVGVDPEGVVRALLTNFRSGKKQGASTITQQVAKNFFLTPEQTVERKIREALTALRIESTFSKDKILELYLNQIFLGTLTPGRNLYGVAAASLDYFGKSVHELTTAEAGYLAEEVRREIGERYGEEKLYEGGLSIRATLDPKMQAMARKALTDGLVRFDEARGWRGAQHKMDLAGREWGLALADVPALGDVQPWRIAVVLKSAAAR